MRYSGYYNCKMCGKTWNHKSNYIPFELVDWFYNLLFFFHLIFNHGKELDFKKIVRGLSQVLLQIMIAVLWIIVFIIRIIFYPFKLMVDVLY